MRLPFRRRRNVELESVEALHSATENLMQVRERGEEITELAKNSKLLREKNHFSEQLEIIMTRRPA